MALVLLKADGTEPTEGKLCVIFCVVTEELREFLRTGHGWEMGVPDVGGSDEMQPVTAWIRRDRKLWIKLARFDQSMIFFRLCRILKIPFRAAVWQFCLCLSACYAMRGFEVHFTALEFSLTGRPTSGKPAPGVDYYDPGVAAFVVCASEEDKVVAERESVPKQTWFEEPTEEGLKATYLVVPIHFDYQQLGAVRTDNPVDLAVKDAIQALHAVSLPGLRGADSEDCVILFTIKMSSKEGFSYIRDHHEGSRLPMMIAHRFQKGLEEQGWEVGVGTASTNDQLRLDIGTAVAMAGRAKAQQLRDRQ
eukprot:3249577-Rhodomonas_salina.3